MLYNLNEVAKLLGIKVRTVRQWIHSGKIVAAKHEFSNRWFVTQEELERLLERMR